MKNNIRKITTIIFAAMFTVFSLAGCGNTIGKDSGKDTGTKKQVKLGYVNWSEGVAMTNLAAVILEDKMGYDVEMTMADAGIIFTSISEGDTDAFLDGWLPVTHKEYMETYKDKVVDLGYNFENARIGLVVPAYVEIDSIEEFNSVSDKFKGKIIGIDAGAGIMNATETAIKEYGLDAELIEGSGPAMTTMLKQAIDKNEYIAVTGWKPHWKFARWDLKFLEDPKKVYGEVENIHTIARLGLEEDMPDVATFLKNFKMDDKQLGGLMGMIADSDKDPLEVAREWMNQNEELVNNWIPNK